jgi:TonB family protein
MRKSSLLSVITTTLLITNFSKASAQAVVRVAPKPTAAKALASTALTKATPAAPTPASAPAEASTVIPTFVEEMPRFRSQGGIDSVQEYLQHSIRYPDDAFIANASGRVYVSFVVNTQGVVEQIKLVKGVYPSLDREALRVVAALPHWSAPGRQHGQAVSVAYTVPVVFQIAMAMLMMRGQAGQTVTKGQLASSVATTGPSFPGGPDSLRAYAARGAHSAGPAADGLAMVEFDLDNDGHPQNVKAVMPSNAKARATPAAYAAAVRLVEHSPAWAMGSANARNRHQLLSFAFGNTKPVSASSYTNLRYPTFPGSQPTLEGLTNYIQRQAQYPEAAMDRREQGRVYVSFEVSESGEVEQVQIIGSVTATLDAEVVRVLKSLPRATTPPINSGQAVRASFTLPVSFVMR